ncbi:MAG: hypothetical protein V9E89_18825 [Ilumatobacteraceae bacterium]
MNSVIVWQPMPAPTRVPGGTAVEVLCGQPLQKYGVRSTVSGIIAGRAGGRGASRSGARRLARRGRERGGDRVGGKRAVAGEQRRAVGARLAVDQGPVGQRVQGVADGALQRRLLLLDDDHLGQAAGELSQLGRVQWRQQPDLEQPQPGGTQLVVAAQPQHGQRGPGLPVGVTTGDDAQPVRRAADTHSVQAVGHAVLPGHLRLDGVQLPFEVEGVGRQQPAGRLRRPDSAIDLDHRDHRFEPFVEQIHRAGPIGYRVDDDDRRPQPAGPGQGDGVPAEVDGLLDVTRKQHGQLEVTQRGVTGRRDRAALGPRVVSHQGDGATPRRGAGEHRMADRVTGPVEAGPLAVPHPDHAVDAPRGDGGHQLGAHDRAGGQLLVHCRLGDHRQAVAAGLQGGRCRVTVVVRQRAARVTGDVGRGVPTPAAIGAQLGDGQAGEGL